MNNTFIVAELSANHNQDLNIAKETILAAKEAGADAVKLQTFTPDSITIDCQEKAFIVEKDNPWGGKTLYQLYKEAAMPIEWNQEIFSFCKKNEIMVFSTPFDKDSADLLDRLDCPIYKIASMEAVDYSFIKYVAQKMKPIIISLGIVTLSEIQEIVRVCQEAGNYDITLLQCTSEYPARLEDCNLRTLKDISERFSCKVGLSDHTIGSLAAATAVAMGATVIEKHFILDKSIGGVDSFFSASKEEFAEYVKVIRDTEKAMGEVYYHEGDKLPKSRMYCRSLFAVMDIKKGEIFNFQNIKSIRPGSGLHPKMINEVIGKRSNCDIKRGTPMRLEFIEGE